jgi:hypothetical protein
MGRQLAEYAAVTVLGLLIVFVFILPVLEQTAQSIINTSHCIEQPVECGQ